MRHALGCVTWRPAMAFSHQLPKAARRHLEAADSLHAGRRPDVAGYLYGIAAECAIKQMVIALPMSSECSKREIEYAHFPELRTLLRDALRGRTRAMQGWAFIQRDAFMNNWHVSMRYADASQIQARWVDDWRKQAHEVVEAMAAAS